MLPYAFEPGSTSTTPSASGRPFGCGLISAISGYKKFYDFFVNEYYPGTRTTLAAYDLPKGRRYYQEQIREFQSSVQQPFTQEMKKELAKLEAAKGRRARPIMEHVASLTNDLAQDLMKVEGARSGG